MIVIVVLVVAVVLVVLPGVAPTKYKKSVWENDGRGPTVQRPR
jgi:hypothetical protein